jgi:apolipoprotein N-acyltransferase
MRSVLPFFARCLIVVLSGAIFAGAFPPVGWRWLVVPGVAGLLLALRGQHGTRARTLGFLHGLSAYALGLSWLYQIFGGAVVMLWMVLAAFTALFAEMQARVAARGIVGWRWAIFTAINWGGWEFIRAELFPLRFPWMTAGLALGPNGFAPWIGVYGVGLFVILAVALGLARNLKTAALMIALLVGAMRWPGRCPEPTVHDPRSVPVAGLQLEGVSLNPYLEGTRALPPGVKHVVWPEYAAPYDIRAHAGDWRLLQTLCQELQITLTLGTQARNGNDDQWRNIALTLDPSGVLGEHTKVHTVHFFDDGTPGTTALPVATSRGKVGTPICFDCDYEGVVRRMTAAGAEWLAAPTMDAEKWTARQHDQHAELFRMRACENGRWLLVSATSGVSQIIDSRGYVHTRLGAMEQGAITGILKRESALTFYTRAGWLTPWLVLVVAAVAWGRLLVSRKGGATGS